MQTTPPATALAGQEALSMSRRACREDVERRHVETGARRAWSLSAKRCSLYVKSSLQGGVNIPVPADISTLFVPDDILLKPVPK